MKLFGSPARTRTMALLALLDRTYLRELARVSGSPLLTIQRTIKDLQREGVVATRIVGANREVSLNPRFYGAKELRAFLLKYGKRDPQLEQRVSMLRRRPRGAGTTL